MARLEWVTSVYVWRLKTEAWCERTILLGDAENRRMYSRVNQPMQPASTKARCSFSVVEFPRLSTLARDGIVLIVSAIVETIMNRIDTIANTCKQRCNQRFI